MEKQTVKFAVVVKDGVVQEVGAMSVPQPKTAFKGGTISWYEDKPKQKER